MRTSNLAVAGLFVAAVVTAACSDAGTGLSADQAAVQAAYEQLTGYIDDDFGDPGATGTTPASATFSSFLSAGLADTAIAPEFWGRLRVVRGGPRPVFTRVIVVQGDSGWVTRNVDFQGIFLVDTSADAVFNPTSKPLADGVQQRAVFVRDGSAPRGWRLVALTLLNWQNTALDRRTVQITNVAVYKNDSLVLQVDNPDSLIDVDRRVPKFREGDTVRVVAQVENTTGGGFSPTTLVFLHVRHADPSDIRWRRVQMVDNGNGEFERSWIVRHPGRDRFVVDALDAATLMLGTADNYRSNEWGIPFLIQ
ncbi:MAG: hypothetical protein ACREMF_11755 [Gemmatimonadales bacterium]